MAEADNPLAAWSDRTAQIVELAASSMVAVHGGSRSSSSGVHWRSGVIVTAEERLESDGNIKVALPGGRLVEASLVGRDPTTDVAVLRFQPDGLPDSIDRGWVSTERYDPGSRSEIMRVVRSPRLASSLLPAALGIVRVAAQSIASFALTSPSAQQPRAAPSSTCKDTSSGWRFSDRGAARWRFPA
jgi:hypothetical protein